ncbi:MAG: hypothetical protein RR329_06910 [Mucinivorans sp.]
MKLKTLILAMMTLSISLASCKDDNQDKNAPVTVNAKYKIDVGMGIESALSSDSPGLNALDTETKAAHKTLNDQFKTIDITGKGVDIVSAKEDANKQAIAAFKSELPKITPQIEAMQTSFIANRKLKAAQIKLETNSYLKITCVIFIREMDQAKTIISENGNFKMEAIGGTDYSL